ncbi:hypothetical protein ACFQL4_05145 [Halosimplex aquaticum]
MSFDWSEVPSDASRSLARPSPSRSPPRSRTVTGIASLSRSVEALASAAATRSSCWPVRLAGQLRHRR